MGFWGRDLVDSRNFMCGNVFESLQTSALSSPGKESEPPRALYFWGGVGLYSCDISLVLLPIII